MNTNTLKPERLQKIDADWRAANYLSVGQVYLYDNPELIVVGDGEAETGPLATTWHSNKFLDPATDGAPMHEAMATTLGTAVERIKEIQQDASVRSNQRPSDRHAKLAPQQIPA